MLRFGRDESKSRAVSAIIEVDFLMIRRVDLGSLKQRASPFELLLRGGA